MKGSYIIFLFPLPTSLPYLLSSLCIFQVGAFPHLLDQFLKATVSCYNNRQIDANQFIQLHLFQFISIAYSLLLMILIFSTASLKIDV